MVFPTLSCKEASSGVAMKQSFRLVKEVSLSMSWMKSIPVKIREEEDINKLKKGPCRESLIIFYYKLYIT